ncbi:MAG TPA: polysaccharide biosynthesis tyrosine autokinase [Candidatus Limnocylindrales bacterium]
MDVQTAVRVLRRRWWLPVLFVVAAAVPAYLVSRSLPKVYEADTTLLVGLGLPGTSPDYQQLLASQQLSQTYSSIVTTGPLLEAVKEDLDLDMTIDALRKSVTATAPVESTLITITASDGDPARAAQIADALAQELISRSPSISTSDPAVRRIVTDLLDGDLQSMQEQISTAQSEITRLAGLSNPTPEDAGQLAALRGQLPSLQQAYATILGYASSGDANILTVVDPAQVPTEPTSPRVALNTLIIALLALVNAIALVFLLEYLDDTLKTPDDVEALIGLPTIGTITLRRLGPSNSPRDGLATLLYPRGEAAEAYRTLRTNVDIANVDDPIRVVLVTSAVPKEGKTTTAANLAVAIAQTGSNTILLDADLRSPGVHRMFDLPNHKGMTSLLGPDDANFEWVAQATEQPYLRVITTGPLPVNPVEVLASRRMARFLEALRARVDFIVIDSPPLQGLSDAAVLSTLVDGTVLVVSAGRTRRNAVRDAAKALAARGGRTLGVVLDRQSKRDEQDSDADRYGVKGAPAAAQADEQATLASARGALRPDPAAIRLPPDDVRQ